MYLKVTKIFLSFLLFITIPSSASAIEKLRVHIPTYSEVVMPLLIANSKGFYQREGLEVSLIIAPGAVGVKALIAGEFDITTAIGSALNANLRGLPLKILFITDYKPMFWLYSRPEIKSIEELKKKKIAISSLGSAGDTLFRSLIRKKGMSDKDFVIIVVGAGTTRYLALYGGSVEGAVLSSPSNILADEAGLRKLIFFGDEFEAVKGGVASSERFIKENPLTIQKFIRATLKGLKYFKTNKEGSIPLMIEYMKLSEKLARTLYDIQISAFTDNGIRGEEFQKDSIQIQMIELGIKQSIPVSKAFDLSFAKKADEELKSSGWTVPK